MAKRMSQRWRIAGAILLLTTVALAVWLMNPPAAPLKAGAPGATLLNAAAGLDTIDIDATLQPLNRTMTVKQTLRLVNRTGAVQRLLVLRTYANAMSSEDVSPAATEEMHDACYPDGFSAGSLTFTSFRLQVSGGGEQVASYAYGDDAHTVLRVSLPSDWAQGDTLTLQMRYTLLIPEAAYRLGMQNGLWTVGNAFVIPSPFVDGENLTDPYYSIGDPFVSECRNYTVRVTAPDSYTVAGTGTAWALAETEGVRTTEFTALASRDFALCLSDGYHLAETMRDGVLVQAYALSSQKAETMLRYAAQAIACYDARYGAYPYPTLSLCEADIPFGGMEYPSMLMISSAKLNAGGETLEQLVAHEVAHQWWYAVVGNDQYRQAWQDEALAQFSMLDYWETYYGSDARDSLQFSQVDTAMRLTIPQGVTPGSPVDYFGDLTEYGIVVYNRGAAAMCALNTAMNGGLDGFLSHYATTFAFRLATRNDFETLLSSFTGEDWSPLLSDYLDTYIN